MSNNGWNWRKPPGCPEPPEPDEFGKVEEDDPEDDPSFWYRVEEYEQKRKKGEI